MYFIKSLFIKSNGAIFLISNTYYWYYAEFNIENVIMTQGLIKNVKQILWYNSCKSTHVLKSCVIEQKTPEDGFVSRIKTNL